MYRILYRKWRPRQFPDVVGQPWVTSTLKSELLSGGLAHVYLFIGSRGTGKTICAKTLAKAANCLNPQNDDPRGECEICRGLNNGSMMDVVKIDAASDNGVGNIRTLREETNFTPAAVKYRVYIIDEVHMPSIDVFNALLRTLEEPSEHVIFILVTIEVHRLPITTLSRCQRFDFRRIVPADITDHLTYIADEENASIESQAALLPAGLVDSTLHDVFSLLDQCLGRSRDVTVDIITQTAGLAGWEHLSQLADAIIEKDTATALLAIDELYTAPKDMARLCEELSGYFHGLTLPKTMKDARDILAIPEEEYQAMSARALPTLPPVILHCLDTMQDALERMYRGGNWRIEMETAVLRLCSPELDSGTDALIRQIVVLEREGVAPAVQMTPLEPQVHRTLESTPAAVAAPALPVSPASTVQRQEPDNVPPWMEELSSDPYEPAVPALPSVPEEPVSKEASEQPVVSQAVRESGTSNALEELQDSARPLDVWSEILQTMKDYSQVVVASFARSIAYVSGEYVSIGAPSPTALELLRRPAQRDKMRDAIKQVMGCTYKLRLYKKLQIEQTREQDSLKALAESVVAAGIPVIQQ